MKPKIVAVLFLVLLQLSCTLAGAVPGEQPPVLRVGIYQNPPKLYLDARGRPAGFFPELLDTIARREGWAIEYVPCVWNQCLEQVASGILDLMMDVAYSEERARRFDFNREVVLGNWSRVYVRDGTGIRSILDLDRKKIAVVRGSIQQRKLEEDARAFSIQPEFLEVDSLVDVFAEVARGRVDAGVVNRLFGAQQMMNFGLRPTSVVLYPSRLMFVATKGRHRDVLERIDLRLEELKNDSGSVYHSALKKVLTPAKRVDPPLPGLSATQLSWLAAHPEITIAVNRAWPPMDYVDESGEVRGVGVDFIAALNRRLGNVLKIVPLSWEEMYEGVREKRIDALMDITPRPEREPYFNFTKPYLVVPQVIFAPADGPYYESLADLAGRTVAVERAFFLVRVLRESWPTIRVEEFDTTSDALDAVIKGEADAFIGNRAVAMYIMEQELIAGLRAMGKIEEVASVNAIGVRKDWPILRDILQAALDDMDRDEISAILRNWLDSGGEGPTITIALTPEEKAWIAAHPVLHLGYDIARPPVEYVDGSGRFIGISADFMAQIGEIIGVKIEPAPPQSWPTTMEKIRQGQLDILSAVAPTPGKQEFLLFTEPYLRFPMVIVTSHEAPYIGRLSDLQKRKVAVVRGYASHDILQLDHPELDLLLVDDVRAGLHAVIQGSAYAFVGNLATISHMIGREGLSNLKVSGETPYSFDLSIGVRREEPILAGLMQKTVAAIPEEERNAIYQRWVTVTYERGVDYALVWKILLGSILLVLSILYWNRRLAREVTLRQRAEHELVMARDRAESANRVKSVFLASMSHELRTPLNSIIGFTGIILKELAGPLNIEQKKQLKMVQGSARHLLQLINDVLDISKIEAGEVTLSRTSFSLREMIDQVAASLMPLAHQKGLSLEVDVDPGVERIFSDERRVRQVLLNLVNNAIKFTDRGTVRIECVLDGEWIKIRVTDTGIGIKEEDLERLFVPFQQLDTGLSRQYGGTGLGLSVCKRVLEMLGGTISVRSSYGKGSTFSITLPATTEQEHGTKKDSDHRG
ncbi:transporter substrate-binding domain-containing protein [Desulfolithobacter sp.]